MDTIIDFVMNNYIWFIIGIMVIVMVIVGYIVDKHEFGVKSEEETQPKPEKVKKEKVKKGKKENKVVEEVTEPINEVDVKIDEPILDMTTEDTVVGAEDLFVPLSSDVEEQISGGSNIDEELFAPLNPVEDKKAETITETVLEPEVEFNNETATLEPMGVNVENSSDNIESSEDINPISTEETTGNDSNDVWKF